MEKNIIPHHLPTPNKRNRHWQLMLIGDNGSVLTLNYFKPIGILLLLIVLAGFVSLGFSIFSYQRNLLEKKALTESLALAEKKFHDLQGEMDITMARLARIEARNEMKKTGDRGKAGNRGTIKPIEAEAAPIPNGEASAPAVQIQPQKAPIESSSIAGKMDVRNFRITYNSNRQLLRMDFSIHNLAADVGTVSGHIFVILKPDEKDSGKWLVIPSTELVDGKPVEIKNGRTFKIIRYKSVFLTANKKINPEHYKAATVYVFGREGNLLFNQSIPISILSK